MQKGGEAMADSECQHWATEYGVPVRAAQTRTADLTPYGYGQRTP